MAPVTPEGYVTQIFHVNIPTEHRLDDAESPAGQRWEQALRLVAHSPGFLKLHWNRCDGDGGKVELRVVRETVEQNQQFLASPLYLNEVLPIFKSLMTPPKPIHPTIPDIQIESILSPPNSCLPLEPVPPMVPI